MEYKNSNLNNLSILDTPGFNSNDSEDAQRTIDVINECDALFWVFDVNAGTVNKSSIKLIKENLKKPLYVVINKVDTKSDYDVQQVENLIKRTLKNEGVTVPQLIRFSSSEKVIHKYFYELMNAINSVPHSNDTSDYLNDVMQWVNHLVEVSQESYNESIKICNASSKQIDAMQEKTNTLAVGVQRRCEEAMDLGHYEENFFRDDMIEFSLSEYRSLEDKLKSIYSGAYELSENFFNYGKTVSDYIDNLDYQSNEKNDLTRITEIQESLKKKIAELNKLK
jgi:tRNA U34 5-carboxymethylaminomethyl modifying GTPase MnmE/TrmE